MRVKNSVQPSAIDFTQEDEYFTVQVGNIILATGYDLFDPRRIPNMVTAAWQMSLPAWSLNDWQMPPVLRTAKLYCAMA